MTFYIILSTQKLFHIIVVQSEPFIETISTCYQVFAVKSWVSKVEIKL